MQSYPNVILHLESTDKSVKKAAEMLDWAIQQYPDLQGVILSLNGYDSDARELDEIPEARRTLSELAKAIGANGVARFKKEHAYLLFICLGLGGRLPGGLLWVHPDVEKFLTVYQAA